MSTKGKLTLEGFEEEAALHATGTRKPMPPEIAKGIIKVMGEIGRVEKKGLNTHFNYRFAAVGDILAKVTPLMAEHGINVLPIEVERKFTEHKMLEVTYEMLVFHESGVQWEERPRQTAYAAAINSKGNFDDKALNKCHTGARKYFILSLFNISTSDIPDADEDDYAPMTNGNTEQPPRQQRPLPGTDSKKLAMKEWCDNAKKALMLMNNEREMVNWESDNKDTLDKVFTISDVMYQELVETMKVRRGQWK